MVTEVDKPRFVHDCESCDFVGHFAGHDLYLCPLQGGTRVARYGNEGSEYTSVSAQMVGELVHNTPAALPLHIAGIIKLSREVLVHMTREDRVTLFSTIVDDYCRFCGRRTEGICHCENDE